uniref:Uncharacterized protein n=1 Tax=Mycena chlorophos TaxID=658473 RepID=A0ABQ0LC08_MYCCL|nr:predicted protein [Mycena chlorophos]
MALPPHFTTRDISGQFTLNFELSENLTTLPDGFPEKLAFNHYIDDDGSEHIWVEQEIVDATGTGTTTAKIVVSDDHRVLDWCERPRDDPFFGRVVGRIRRIQTPILHTPFLRAGWTADTRKHGVLQYDLSDEPHTWLAYETWGVEEIDGERYFARHVRFVRREEEVLRRLVYDYVGSV